jgi:recombination protein RecT
LSDLIERAKAAQGGGRVRKGGEEWVFSVRDEIAELLEGSPFHVDSYLQNAYQQIKTSKLLVQATSESPATVQGAIVLGATLQLQIGGPLGHFYLTPRNEGRGQDRRAVCVPMIGYRGFFELGYRSGTIAKYDYLVVREGDTFRTGSDSERGNWYEFESADADAEERPLTHVVALAHKVNGAIDWRAMSRATIEKRRPTQIERTPWVGKHAEQMYIKTPHRELAKYQQLSIALATAATADEQISSWNQATSAIEQHDPDATTTEHDETAPPADEDREADTVPPPTSETGVYATQEEYEAAVARGEAS